MAGRRWWGVGAVAIVLAGALLLAVTRSTSPLEEALALTGDDSGFSTSTEAAVTLARVSTLLKQAAEDCGEVEHPRCEHLFSAAAWAQLAAVEVLQCTRPGVAAARRSLRFHLQELAAGTYARALPELPDCR